MINQQLLEYIKSQLSQNVSKEGIKNNLMTEGWSIDDINHALLSLDTTTIPIKIQKESRFRLLNPIMFVATTFLVNYVVFFIGITQNITDIVRSTGITIGVGFIAVVFILKMRAEKRLSFSLFFTSYILLFLGYSLLYPLITVNVSISTLPFLLAAHLSFPIVIAYLASFLSVTALFDSTKKIAVDFVTFLIICAAYGSFSYYFFFMRVDKITPIFIGLILATAVALAIKSVSKGNPITIKRVLIGICLVSLGLLVAVATYSKTVDVQSCGSFSNADQRYQCTWALAMKDMNLDLCLNIDMKSNISGCLSNVLLDLYKNKKLDTEYCSALKNSDAQSVCFNRLVLIDPKESYCENVKEKYDSQSVFIYQSPFDKDGIVTRNSEVGGAELRGNRLDRTGCYSNVALIKQLPSICSPITDEFQKRGCEIDAGIK